ncbi:MAG: GNAT family N-acetyltransferase [Armatimonadetes bacterium]|nr:GNAT family N-acetyltransferase [Armatimonadota bacterium]
MSVEIDDYRAGDEVRMAEIAARAFARFARHGIDYTLPRELVDEYYSDEVLDYASRCADGEKDLQAFVARRGGEVLGHVVVRINHGDSQQFQRRWGVIQSLAVDPDYHHQGIGTKLIEAAMRWFRDQLCEYVEVGTDQNNIAAIRLYEAAGFRVIYSGLTLSQRLER